MLRYAFSSANTGVDISEHPLVKEADIIHLHWINQGYISLKGLKKLFDTGKPIVWTQHDMWSFTGGCHYAGTCLEFLEKCSFCTFLKKPSKNDLSARQFVIKKRLYRNVLIHPVACSKWLRASSSESSLFRDKEVSSIPNPIDTELFKPMDKTECRKDLSLPTDKKLLLFGAANVSDLRKGARYLFEALDILIESFPVFKENVEIVVFGKISQGSMDSLPVTIHRMNFISDVSDIVKLYNASDIFVLPSLQDNLPNTVMESMACGTPVVGFRIGGVPEMIEHKYSGFLAEGRNALSLATGIYETLFLLDIEEISRNARQKVLNEYTGDVVAKQYVELYEKLLNSSSH
jgi:glycosyltransferase involved in cell wall biosynthesis